MSQIAAKWPSRFSRDPCFEAIRSWKCRKWRQSYLLPKRFSPPGSNGRPSHLGGQGVEIGHLEAILYGKTSEFSERVRAEFGGQGIERGINSVAELARSGL